MVPSRGSGWLDGVPLGPIEAAAVPLVWWAWAACRRLPGARLLMALVIAKTALGAALVERGFEARYYANAEWAAPVERSTDFRDRPYTRRDEQLAFGTGLADLPLHFFNDLRFNFNSPTEPDRDRLAYSVVWEGVLRVEDNRRPTTFYVRADDSAVGGLWIDGRSLLVLDRASPRTGSVALEPGWHRLRVSVAAPYGASRQFEAGEMVGDVRRPFDGTDVFPRPVGPVRGVIDAIAAWTIRVMHAVVLVWLAGLVLVRVRSALRDVKIARLLWLGAILEAVGYAWPHAGRVTMLSGGGDMLMYEHLSRVILLGDPLLTARGPGGGQGGPFYFQPLYPYFVTIGHMVFGEDLFGIVFLQRLLVAVSVASTAAITWRFFGSRAGWIAVVAGGLFTYAKLGRWSDVVLAEPLFTPILAAWVWTLVRLATEPASSGRLVLAGILGGTATLTRSTLLMAWPVILPVWWRSVQEKRTRRLAVLLASMIAVVGLATLRNWIVADRFVPVATSFGINFYLGNQPTRPLAPPPSGRSAFYDTLGLEQGVRNVVEFAIQAPDAFARGLVNKALYSVGFFGWSGLPGGIATSWLYVGIWVLAIVAVARMTRTPDRWGPAVWLPAAGALTHFAAVVLVFPHGYTDRLIVPLYPLLIPYAAYALEPLPPVIVRAATRLQLAFEAAGNWVRRRAVPVVAPVLRQRRNWLYLAYAAAATQSADPLTALLLPVTALVVARLTRQDVVHRVVAGTLWAVALVHVAAAGSLSPDALHDPLFWGLLAVIALGGSLSTGRWPFVAAATAAIAGACTMVATLLPFVTAFDANAAIASMSSQIGPVVVWCLFGVWLQSIVAGRTGTGRLTVAGRGALFAALVLAFAGAVPGDRVDTHVWIVALGMLLGLVEAKARETSGTRGGIGVRRGEHPDDQHHHR